MTIKDITQAAAGTFMSRSCASSKFTLINGSQIDEFQEEEEDADNEDTENEEGEHNGNNESNEND